MRKNEKVKWETKKRRERKKKWMKEDMKKKEKKKIRERKKTKEKWRNENEEKNASNKGDIGKKQIQIYIYETDRKKGETKMRWERKKEWMKEDM